MPRDEISHRLPNTPQPARKPIPLIGIGKSMVRPIAELAPSQLISRRGTVHPAKRAPQRSSPTRRVICAQLLQTGLHNGWSSAKTNSGMGQHQSKAGGPRSRPLQNAVSGRAGTVPHLMLRPRRAGDVSAGPVPPATGLEWNTLFTPEVVTGRLRQVMERNPHIAPG
jgi:hypothetical protein